MFDELKKYGEGSHFFFEANKEMATVCNAPSKHGVFLIYSLNRGRIEMVYIGCTDPTAERSDLKNEIESRSAFLKKKMKDEGADALDIYWYVTSSRNRVDAPKEVELAMMQQHLELFGTIPRWNK